MNKMISFDKKRHFLKECWNQFYLVSRTVWVVVQQDLQLVRAEHDHDDDWPHNMNYCDDQMLVFTCVVFFIGHLRVWSNRA